MQRISEAAAAELERIAAFWMKLHDPVHGGYYGYMSYGLELDRQAPKGCILNSRILWFFSEAAMLTGREELRREADHAYDFLMEHCIDREYGGIYWSMTWDGKSLDTTKHTYNQGFAIYALSAYYRLSGKQDALDMANAIFRCIEEHCTDEIGYLEAFTRDWGPESNEKLSENGVMAEKTMNTLLHVFEGYSGLYQAAGGAAVGRAMERILNIYAEKIWCPEKKRQLVFFDSAYRSIIDLYSYGHDIESSWLMDWGCGLLEKPELSEKIRQINRQMAQAVYEAAWSWDSLANECDRGMVNETRIWWVQAETVVGLVHQWEKTGEERYRQAAGKTWQFIQRNLVDKRPGSEWFWCVDKFGRPDPEKPIVEPWKCPYHNGRMCMELIRRDPEIYV